MNLYSLFIRSFCETRDKWGTFYKFFLKIIFYWRFYYWRFCEGFKVSQKWVWNEFLNIIKIILYLLDIVKVLKRHLENTVFPWIDQYLDCPFFGETFLRAFMKLLWLLNVFAAFLRTVSELFKKCIESTHDF